LQEERKKEREVFKMKKLYLKTEVFFESVRGLQYIGASPYFRYADLLERAEYNYNTFEEFEEILIAIVDAYYIRSMSELEYIPNGKIIVLNTPFEKNDFIFWSGAEILKNLLNEEENEYRIFRGLRTKIEKR